MPLAAGSAEAKLILAMIVQFFWEPPRGINIIDEPEISLHPESQLQLVELFAAVLKEQKQILITMHSQILVMTVNRAIKRGTLKAETVAIHHFKKKRRSGTVATSLKLSLDGFIKGWITSFAKVERQLLMD